MKSLETEHQMQRLADLVVNDLLNNELSAGLLPVLGRVDSAFYVLKLPAEFKPLAEGVQSATVSSSKLLQRFFAKDFEGNLGWTGAKALYANFMQANDDRSQSRPGSALRPRPGSAAGSASASASASAPLIRMDEIDIDLAQAETQRMLGMAEVIVRTLIGYPPTIDSSPLPKSVLQFLFACDQRLHARLLNDNPKHPFSTDQIRTARLALLTNLIVTRLLQPMLVSLAAKVPSPAELAFLAALMQGLLSGVEQLSGAFFNKSFANSPHALQQRATEKSQQEKINERIQRLQSKPTVRHIRTRSADTEPISPRTLRTVEEARTFRNRQKAGELVRTFETQDWSALDEANRELNENLAIVSAQEDLRQFETDDLTQLLNMVLSDRGNDGFPLTPRRAQRLDDSEDENALPDTWPDARPDARRLTVATPVQTSMASTVTTTANTFTTTTTSTATSTTTSAATSPTVATASSLVATIEKQSA